MRALVLATALLFTLFLAPLARAAPPARNDNLPPSEAKAREVLAASPRQGEYVHVRIPSSKTPIRTWIVYPEGRRKAGVVLLVHETYGLSNWVRGVADQLAQEGFIAVAPDLVSGLGPNGGGTDSVWSRDDVVELVGKLTPEETTARLNAVREFALKLPNANGKIATLGFSWGGSQCLTYAAAQPGLDAAVVYYGSSPEARDLAKIQAPVLAFYGGDDERVTATAGPARDEMKKLGKAFEAETFEGAGHGFLREQEGRGGVNLKAARLAWARTVAFLRERLK